MRLQRSQGDPDVCRALEALAAGSGAPLELRDNGRRRILRLEVEGIGPVLVKHFRREAGARGRLKARLGAAPADREWRALRLLHEARVPVPEPLARGEIDNGDRLVAMAFVAGAPLREALQAAPSVRRALLAELGAAVGALHATGLVHRDLHAGNVLVREERIVLLDVQRAAQGGDADRLRDLGWLDYSLWRFTSQSDRLRVRAAALGLQRPWRDGRERLRRVGREASNRAEEHARSRTRRSLRPGRLYARAACDGWRGMRVRDVDADRLAAVLAEHAEALARGDARVLKDDGRSRITALDVGGTVVVKESPPRGAGRALADVLRGSAARRAWLGGHGLAARDVGAARPLAFLERGSWGLPLASLLVMDDLRPAEPADTCTRLPPDIVVGACARIARALHQRGVDHGDLKASHVFVHAAADGTVEARLLDLDGVRFLGRLDDGPRLQALAELNGSLPDRFPAAARREAFARYAAALPFSCGASEARRTIVRLSLARRHRWSGAGCSDAGG